MEQSTVRKEGNSFKIGNVWSLIINLLTKKARTNSVKNEIRVFTEAILNPYLFKVKWFNKILTIPANIKIIDA